MIEEILKFTNDFIKNNSEKSQLSLDTILKFSNISRVDIEQFSEIIERKACINLHFHADRLSKDGLIIERLLLTGQYKNQFQTGISSGSLSATIGGDRANWENELFGNIFKNKHINERPKYGSLNLTLTDDGASPRFGSCYFITKPGIKNRSTFTYGDSYLLPGDRGTSSDFHQILLRIFEDVFVRNFALGFHYESITDFINATTNNLRKDILKPKLSHNLDFYIESQIHGSISLKDDISDLVLDYSYKNTGYEDVFWKICTMYAINLKWSSGYQLPGNEFPDNFRGNEIPKFTKSISENGKVNAYIIGKSITNKKTANVYSDHELFQLYKYAWHCLVKFGTPIKTSL